jgi:two-component system chemotaxis response regulator CheB
MGEIKVLIVDDAMLFREVLKRELSKFADIEIIAVANDPFDAKDKILALRPDVVTLDIEMPKMDGIKFLRHLLPQFPVPVVVISSLKESVFEAMDAGAIDFEAKPDDQNEGLQEFITNVAEKIRIAARSKPAFRKQPASSIDLAPIGVSGPINPKKLVAIGASTGGTEAIYSMLSKFSINMPPIVVVQHMPAVFTQLYAQRLDRTCALIVKEAVDGDVLAPGKVLIAPGDFHMRVIKNGSSYIVKLDQSEKVNGHRPSVDVLFDSVAAAAGSDSLGIILTGMGTDGAQGLRHIRDLGGYTIGQDERSSVVYGMPMAAKLLGGVVLQLPLYRIADELCKRLSSPV